MRFVILIAGDEASALTMSKEEGERIVAAYFRYTEDLKQAGVLLAGEALEPSPTGARVSAPGGKRKVVDGPFSESKELIGGYYLIDVRSKEEAVEWAARCPAAQTDRSYVEVRAVMEFPS